METKICKKCGEEKNINAFRLRKDSKDGYRNECRDCKKIIDYDYHLRTKDKRHAQSFIYYRKNKEYIKQKSREYGKTHKIEKKEYGRKYYIKNKDKIDKKNKEYAIAHRERLLMAQKRYRQEHKQEIAAAQVDYKRTHKHIRNQKDKKYRDDNPNVKITISMRNSVARVLKKQGASRNEKTFDLIGCSPSFLIQHLESLFTDGMSWDNYGKGYGKWNIDHIIPCAYFFLRDKEQRKVCCHWTNLQPMWEKENISKGSLYNGRRYYHKKS